jgi:hypothetical protein
MLEAVGTDSEWMCGIVRGLGRGMERKLGVVIEVDAIPRHRLVPWCLPQTTPVAMDDQRQGRTCRIARPPLKLDLEFVSRRFILLGISHDRHYILLHLGNPAYPHVSVPKDLLTVRVSIKGSLNLTRLIQVLRDDMTMPFVYSNP